MPSAPTTVQTSSIVRPGKTLSRRRTALPSLSLAREPFVAPASRREQLTRSRGSRHEGVAIHAATTRRSPEAKGQRSSQPSQSATASRVGRGGQLRKNKKLLQTQPAGVIGPHVSETVLGELHRPTSESYNILIAISDELRERGSSVPQKRWDSEPQRHFRRFQVIFRLGNLRVNLLAGQRQPEHAYNCDHPIKEGHPFVRNVPRGRQGLVSVSVRTRPSGRISRGSTSSSRRTVGAMSTSTAFPATVLGLMPAPDRINGICMSGSRRLP